MIEVEGRLGGPWVEELRQSWLTESRRTPKVCILLRAVSFIDEAGRELLAAMFREGAKLEGNGCMVRAMIARITGEQPPDCGSAAQGAELGQPQGGEADEQRQHSKSHSGANN